MQTITSSDWINLCGHAAGVALFVSFLVLARRQSRFRIGGEGLTLFVVAMALVWDIGSIAVIAMGPGRGAVQEALATVALSALSLLPAGLFQIAMRRSFGGLVRTGYGLSAAAVAAHASEVLFARPALHQWGLAVVTFGFGGLTAFAVARLYWASGATAGREATARAVSAMSLFLLAVSFAHFNGGHITDAWGEELVVHHAGIPLALWVLLQDYRFVFLDALIGVIANGVLAAGLSWLVFRLAAPVELPLQVLIGVAAFYVFGFLRNQTRNLLSHLVFRQPGEEAIRESLGRIRTVGDSEEKYLKDVAGEMAGLMGAGVVGIAPAVPAPPTAAAAVRIRMSATESRYVLLGDRREGRPYLTADYDALERLAAAAGEQLERLRLLENEKLSARAELRALQAQINPHFLFNALNTLYGITPREATLARRLTLSLAELFRYFLRTGHTSVTVREELEIVRSYLAIEEQRLGGKLEFSIDAPEACLRIPIPMLSIQPLVENAVKHGVAANPAGGTIRIAAEPKAGALTIEVRDSGAGSGQGAPKTAGAGIGLSNVRRRLELRYGPEASLELSVRPDGTVARLLIPVHPEADLDPARGSAPVASNQPISRR
ncbi:MAG: sensor histidine kinase [Bryobacteraceae bacterium]